MGLEGELLHEEIVRHVGVDGFTNDLGRFEPKLVGPLAIPIDFRLLLLFLCFISIRKKALVAMKGRSTESGGWYIKE